jgi:hypothetical protein
MNVSTDKQLCALSLRDMSMYLGLKGKEAIVTGGARGSSV